MDGWVVLAIGLYLVYAVAFVANHPGGQVTGLRAWTLFPFVVPVMLFWWVVGKAHFTRNTRSDGFTVGIEDKRR